MLEYEREGAKLRGLSDSRIRADENSLAVLLAAASAEGREEMREEAAKVADYWLAEFSAREIIHISSRQYATNAVEDIRDAIRALPKDTGK